MTGYSDHSSMVRIVNDMLLPLSDDDRESVNSTFPVLSGKSVGMMLGVLTDRSLVAPVRIDWTDMDALREIPAYAELAEEWSGMAHHKFGLAVARMWSVLDRLPDQDAKALIAWFDKIPSAAATAIVRRLAA
jgi:hypothetical protein